MKLDDYKNAADTKIGNYHDGVSTGLAGMFEQCRTLDDADVDGWSVGWEVDLPIFDGMIEEQRRLLNWTLKEEYDPQRMKDIVQRIKALWNYSTEGNKGEENGKN